MKIVGEVGPRAVEGLIGEPNGSSFNGYWRHEIASGNGKLEIMEYEGSTG